MTRKREGGKPRSGNRALVWRALAVGAALGVAIWAWETFLPGESVEEGPPALTYEVAQDGVRVARIDVEGLGDWCRRNGLPDPPGIRVAEAAVAENLMEAFRSAAAGGGASAYGRIGQICESLESHQAALDYFDRAENDAGSEFRWPYYRGCVFQVLGRSEDAIAAFERAMALDATYAVTYARLGQLFLEQGRLDDASRVLEKYSELAPEDWLGAVGLGRVAIERGEADVALEHLREAHQLAPDDFQVNFYLATAYRDLGERELARMFFDRARELPQGAWFALRDPLDQELNRAGMSAAAVQAELQRLAESGDWPALARLAEDVVRRRSEDVTMLGNLASIYRKMERFDEAHELLDRALAVGTDELRLRNLRAETYLAQNRFEETIRETTRVLEIDEEESRAHGVRARALLMLERYPEAERSMRRCVELDPSNGTNWFVLGESLLAQGNLGGAEEAYRQTIGLLPQYGPARDRLAEIEASR